MYTTMTNVSTYALFSIAALITSTSFFFLKRKFEKERAKKRRNNLNLSTEQPINGAFSLIGNSPMIRLNSLSQAMNCNMFVKMESMNPGGTGKDRAAKYMLLDAMKHPLYHKGCTIIEGTSGSTGIALAPLCKALGLRLHVVMPDDQAAEKKKILETLGATVAVVPSCAISNGNHYVNTARRFAESIGGIFLNQFENKANFRAHFQETGPEIWKQMEEILRKKEVPSKNNLLIDAFVMSAGTGGTIAGVSRYLKSRDPRIRVVLADPEGSSLYNRVKHGVCFTAQQTERRVRRHRYDSIVEGVGLDRVTANFSEAAIDDAVKVCDQEIIDTAHWLLKHEGLFVGSSSALNVAAACRTAHAMGTGCTVLTVICDSGHRHTSRFWSRAFIEGDIMEDEGDDQCTQGDGSPASKREANQSSSADKSLHSSNSSNSKYNLRWPSQDVIPACISGVARS